MLDRSLRALQSKTFLVDFFHILFAHG
jgi:hypothetical protein